MVMGDGSVLIDPGVIVLLVSSSDNKYDDEDVEQGCCTSSRGAKEKRSFSSL